MLGGPSKFFQYPLVGRHAPDVENRWSNQSYHQYQTFTFKLVFPKIRDSQITSNDNRDRLKLYFFFKCLLKHCPDLSSNESEKICFPSEPDDIFKMSLQLLFSMLLLLLFLMLFQMFQWKKVKKFVFSLFCIDTILASSFVFFINSETKLLFHALGWNSPNKLLFHALDWNSPIFTVIRSKYVYLKHR